MAFKWGLLIKIKNQQDIDFLPLVKSYYLSSVVSSVVPPTIGEDIVRGLSVTKDGFKSENVLSSILAERLFGALSMFLLSGVTLFLLTWYYPQVDRFLFYSAVFLSFILILIIALSLYLPLDRFVKSIPFLRGDGKLASFFQRSYKTYQTYGQYKKRIIIFVLLSILENCFVVVGLYWIALSLGINVRFIDMFLTVPAITLFSKIPITFGGIGVQEGIFIKMLSIVGVSSTPAFSISLVGRILNVLAVLPIFTLLYFWGLNSKKHRVSV